MNYNQIKENIDSQKFKIINITKCKNNKYSDKGNSYMHLRDILTEADINNFFEKLDEKINSDSLTFIILNEFFFSYHEIIIQENYELILKSCKKITKEKKNVILVINLCHQVFDEKISSEYENNIKTYLDKIYDNDLKVIWNISTHGFDEIFSKKTNKYYSNETFVLMRGEQLYSYKKSTYYQEIKDFSLFNYIIGFGTDIINKELKNELLDIAKLLSNKLSIEICFDLQKNIKTRKFENILLFTDDEDFNNIKELIKIRANVQNYDQKKLIIIQSNVTNIFDQLNIFPPNIIISKCDPIQELVFTLEDTNLMKDINIIKSHNKNIIDNEKQKGALIGFKEERLNKRLEELNNECAHFNAVKLIKKYTPKNISNIKLDKHQYIYFEYDFN